MVYGGDYDDWMQSQRGRFRSVGGLFAAFGVSSALAAATATAGAATANPRQPLSTIETADASTATTFNVDETQTSVSGLSSGAYMAVQFQVAFSSTIRGVAAFGGGPYDCAEGSLTTAESSCMDVVAAPDAAVYVALATTAASAGDIDPVSNLANQNVFLFGGADDTSVAPVVTDGLDAFYKALLTTGSVVYESRYAATADIWPTLTYGGSCDIAVSPFMGACNYDGAGKALNQIYGTLNSPSTSPAGTYLTLSQADFLANPSSHSLGDSAYVYVPTSCAAGAACRIHVAFHGCLQSVQSVGTDFYENSGLNVWADTNGILVLYPQTITSTSNLNGCWDWWGYDSADYAKKTGPQMSMVKAMIDHLASGFAPTTDGGASDSGTTASSDAAVTGDASDAVAADGSGTLGDAAGPSTGGDAGGDAVVSGGGDSGPAFSDSGTPGDAAVGVPDASGSAPDASGPSGSGTAPRQPSTGACSFGAATASPLSIFGLVLATALLSRRRKSAPR